MSFVLTFTCFLFWRAYHLCEGNMAYMDIVKRVFKEIMNDEFRVGAKKEEYLFWDSLHHVKLMHRLESELKLKFTAAEALSIRDIDGLINLVEAKYQK